MPKPLLFSLQPSMGKQKKPFALVGDTTMAPATAWAPPIRLALVPAAFSTANFGFFCRQELRWEKNIKIPFRFRLGSVQQCDRLEGKRVAVTQ